MSHLPPTPRLRPDDSPAREQAIAVVRRLQEAGYTAFWAGGCVRDLLLGLEPADYDVATNAVPEQVRQLFGTRQTLAIGAAFGVILVRGPHGTGDVEVATFRTEGPYRDGRRPEHVAYSTPEEDAQRRDFTINGLFFDPLSAELFDYVGGREDLERRVVRAIGDPHERFTEDKLRILRAIRISARFGFELDPRTAEAVCSMAEQITVVSQERIAQELRKILLHSSRRRAIHMAADLGVLEVILPELAAALSGASAAGAGFDREQWSWQSTLTALDRVDAPGFELGLALLLSPLGESGDWQEAARLGVRAGRRLKLSNTEVEHIGWLLQNAGLIHELPSASLARRKRALAHPWARELITLVRTRALARGESPAAADDCERFLAVTPAHELQPPPLVTGDDLIRMQLIPGKRFKEILQDAYDAQLEGRVNDREGALAWLSQRIVD